MLAGRTENGFTARFDDMRSELMLIKYFDEVSFAARANAGSAE